MTICIAAVTGDGSIVACCDRLVSTDYMTYEPKSQKIIHRRRPGLFLGLLHL